MVESIDRSRSRRHAPRAESGSRSPWRRKAWPRACASRGSSAWNVGNTSVDELEQVDDIGPKVAASLDAYQPRDQVRGARRAARRRASISTSSTRTPSGRRRRPADGQDRRRSGTIADPRSGAKMRAPSRAPARARRRHHRSSSASTSTDLLITGENVGASKTAKAKKLGVDVVDQGETGSSSINARARRYRCGGHAAYCGWVGRRWIGAAACVVVVGLQRSCC